MLRFVHLYVWPMLNTHSLWASYTCSVGCYASCRKQNTLPAASGESHMQRVHCGLPNCNWQVISFCRHPSDTGTLLQILWYADKVKYVTCVIGIFYLFESGEHHNAVGGYVRHVSTCSKLRIQLENEGKGKAGKYTVISATSHKCPESV